MRSGTHDPRSSFRQAVEADAAPATRSTKPAPRLTLRFTAAELERLKVAAADLPLSAYVRKVLFSGETTNRKGGSRRPVADQEALARVLGLLGRSGIARSLDRLAREARTGCLPLDPPTLVEIEQACTHVRTMRDQLVAALGLIESRSR